MEAARTRRENEIWQVCDELWALHGTLKSMTGDAIRDYLVGLGFKKGSPNEIYKYRKSWLTSRGVSEGQSEVSEAQDTDPISRAVQMVHEQLKAETHVKMDALKAQHDQNLEEWVTRAETLGEKCEQLKHELATLTEQYEQALADRNGLQMALIHQEREQSVLRMQNKTLEGTYAAWRESIERTQDQLLRDFGLERASQNAQITDMAQKLREQGARSMDETNSLKITIRELELELKQCTLSKEMALQQLADQKGQGEVITDIRDLLQKIQEASHITLDQVHSVLTIFTNAQKKLFSLLTKGNRTAYRFGRL